MDGPSSVFVWLIEVLFGTSNWQWFVQNDPMTYYIIAVFSGAIILATISFVFKFLLKLVDR